MAEVSPPRIIPFFRYQDASAALDWLERAFGFRRTFEVPGENGDVAHAQMALGDSMIMLGTGADMRANGGPPRRIEDVRQGMYVYVADIEAHYERAKGAGAEILRTIEDTPYGSREYSALDPGGYYWSFGTYAGEE